MCTLQPSRAPLPPLPLSLALALRRCYLFISIYPCNRRHNPPTVGLYKYMDEVRHGVGVGCGLVCAWCVLGVAWCVLVVGCG